MSKKRKIRLPRKVIWNWDDDFGPRFRTGDLVSFRCIDWKEDEEQTMFFISGNVLGQLESGHATTIFHPLVGITQDGLATFNSMTLVTMVQPLSGAVG